MSSKQIKPELVPAPCKTLPGILELAKAQGRELDPKSIAYTLGFIAGDSYEPEAKSSSDSTPATIVSAAPEASKNDTLSLPPLIPAPCKTLPEILELAKSQGRDLDPAAISFVLGYVAGEEYKEKEKSPTSECDAVSKPETSVTAKTVKADLLPAEVQPTSYLLTLYPDLVTFAFKGEVAITIVVTKPTSSIQLHAKELNIVKASVGNNKMKGYHVLLADDLLTLDFEGAIAAGTHVLSIDFVGAHNTSMAGFYRSSYTAVTGEKRVMVSTQFECLDARRCFPCWDEPAAKATFTCTLVVKAGLTALSNMPIKQQRTTKDGLVRFEYMPTPKMSTYLLAFAVGEFDFVGGTTKHGVSIRCYTPPGRGNQGRFALDVALRCLDIYDDFFGLPYPLPKLDMIAIPEFAAGAMENWGLVTYREVDLLIDDAEASASQKQRVCTVVTHELAHQWFGNLVTMQWWDDLWLNEGFASWMQNYTADKLFPKWQMWDQFVSGAMSSAQRLDSLKSSHPIQVPIRRAEEVEQVFDAISYYKGACVVRMAHAFMGEAAFQKGLQIYMKKHQYGNTVTLDLWKAWQEASGENIPALMGSWTEQMGHPLLTVTTQAGKSNSFQVSQSWFLADGSDAGADGPTWNVPMCVGSDACIAGESVAMLQKDQRTATVTLTKPFDSWVNVNAGQPTMARVLYPEAMYSALSKAASAKQLSAVDRAALVSDAYALTKVGKLKPSVLLQMMSFGSGETELCVWDALSGAILGVNKGLAASGNDALLQRFRKWAVTLVAPAVARVGWESRADDGHLSTLLRSLLITLLGNIATDDKATLAEASRRFQCMVADINAGGCGQCKELPSDIKEPVFKIVLRAGGLEQYQQVQQFCAAAKTIAEKKFAYSALGFTSDPKLKQRTLEWARDELKLQDFFYPMASVQASGADGADIAWKFLQSNFDMLAQKLIAASPSLLSAVIRCCCQGKSTSARTAEVEAFFKKPEVAAKIVKVEQPVQQMLESMRNSAAFIAKLTELEGCSFLGADT